VPIKEGNTKVISVINIITLYVALYLVIIIHELGHFPEKIKFKFGIMPNAAAMRSRFRLGGLIANLILFLSVYQYHPENLLIQYLGLISWIHFIFYLLIGSLMKEPKIGTVNIKTYVFDDVPNEYNFYFIVTAIITFISLKSYYLPIFKGVFL